ncbi:MAG: bifunctional adenosylcobinamide kinase/adenosylcobinamide-phosphate guanylyltransferase [Myxococcales bacterium]|nr:bifunctional adenosylcobinamide kinase/adenosylcobinamide-phosphate guanylyltransferase [Myxococcales bacterium]
MILVGGGVRSGKSAFALARAEALGTRRAFVATAEALDDEMRDRIDRHRRSRGPAFLTVEAPLELPEAISRLGDLADVDVVVIDCLTLWLSNLLGRETADREILAQVERLCATLSERHFHSVVVTNEVGMGVVPPSPLGRRFRDLAGSAHQRLTAEADEVYMAMLGMVLRMRPSPIEVTGAMATNAG